MTAQLQSNTHIKLCSLLLIILVPFSGLLLLKVEVKESIKYDKVPYWFVSQ